MGEMKIILSDDLEKVFRKAAMRRFGYIKGSMSKAAQEALENWASTREYAENDKDPVDLIFGLGKKVKMGSVELQHHAWDFVEEKYLKKRKK